MWKGLLIGVDTMGHKLSSMIAATFLLILINSCSFSNTQQQNGSARKDEDPAETQGTETPTFPLDSQTPNPTTDPSSSEGGTSMKVEEISQLVKADMASMLGIAIEEIQVLDVSARIWSDAGLECSTRKGFYEPEPVPGYQIILSHEDREYRYHTDQEGQYAFCPDPGKPIDPIR
jgi:hypothetical protein